MMSVDSAGFTGCCRRCLSPSKVKAYTATVPNQAPSRDGTQPPKGHMPTHLASQFLCLLQRPASLLIQFNLHLPRLLLRLLRRLLGLTLWGGPAAHAPHAPPRPWPGGARRRRGRRRLGRLCLGGRPPPGELRRKLAGVGVGMRGAPLAH
jgi:hypothetical protein